jgi:hypothetical protein
LRIEKLLQTIHIGPSGTTLLLDRQRVGKKSADIVKTGARQPVLQTGLSR